MRMGDDIMATATARQIFQKTGHKVAFGKPGRIYWSEVFENNPSILQPAAIPDATEVYLIQNYPGNRPYLSVIHDRHIVFNPAHCAVAGDIYLSPQEVAWAAEFELPNCFSVIEPHVKATVSGNNKDWGWDNWLAYRKQQPLDSHWVQLGPEGTKVLPDTLHITTPTFRHALAILNRASWFAGTDGGLHHAAAAMGIPGVVVWGGFSPPEVLGYRLHYNIGGGWCGALDDCDHCKEAMAKIRPGELP